MKIKSIKLTTKKSLAIGIIVCVLGIIGYYVIDPYYWYWKYFIWPHQYPTFKDLIEPDDLVGQQFLYEYIPDYDHFTLDSWDRTSNNLPAKFNLDGAIEIPNGKLIGISLSENRIIEYDPQFYIVTRISYPFPLRRSCYPPYTAHVNNTLYIACEAELFSVDLDSGKMVNKYSLTRLRDLNGIADIEGDGDNLWVLGNYSQRDDYVITKIDTKSGKISDYTAKEVGTPLIAPAEADAKSCKRYLANVKDSIEIIDRCDKTHIYSLDKKTNKWQSTESDSKYVTEFNASVSINLPNFFSLFKMPDKTYLFADDGIYTLKKDQFPVRKLQSYLEQYNNATNTFVNKDETYALILNGAQSESIVNSNNLETIIKLTLINLKDVEFYDLIENNIDALQEIVNISKKDASKLYALSSWLTVTTEFEEKDDGTIDMFGFIGEGKEEKQKFLSINPQTRKLKLYPTYVKILQNRLSGKYDSNKNYGGILIAD